MRPFNGTVTVVNEDTLDVQGRLIKVFSSREPLNFPWAQLDVDCVIDGTGVMKDSTASGLVHTG